MKKLSENLDDYSFEEVKQLALKQINATNIQINYYVDIILSEIEKEI